MAPSFEHALVIGASSGIGEAVARRLAAAGARVALVGRRAERLELVRREIEAETAAGRALAYPHDVRATTEVGELLTRIARDLGGLDLVVFATGIMHRVAEDQYDTSLDHEMLEVNLLGAVAWLNPVAERFARLGRGTIVGVGSIAGDRGRFANPVYNASKAALATYLEALRNRVARHGVRVVTIKPGFVATAMTEGLSGLLWLISAERAAELVLRAARRGATVAYVPARWRLVSLVLRSIPSFVFRRLRV